MTEIRRITPDELPAWFDTMGAVFLEHFDGAAVAAAARDFYDLERTWAGVDGGRVVSTLRTFPTELTLPGGGRIPGSGVSAVTVLPTHRRRGLLTGMIAAEHAAARERGEQVGLLYASEYPIYGRFGYGAAVQQATWTVDALNGRVHGVPAGSVDFVAAADAREHLVAVYERHRAGQAGELARRPHSWDFALGLREWPDEKPWKGRVILHRDADGTVDGYARYTGKETWTDRQPRYTAEINELVTVTDAAYVDLWRFLLEQDLVSTVRAERRRVDEALPWILVNARNAALSEAGDGLFVCLLDVPAALGARTYEREDALVVEVVGGPWGPTARERVRLEAGPDGATCVATAASADLTVPAFALGAACLGGAPLRTVLLAHGADEHTPGALARADALFRTADPPWCTTFF